MIVESSKIEGIVFGLYYLRFDCCSISIYWKPYWIGWRDHFNPQPPIYVPNI